MDSWTRTHSSDFATANSTFTTGKYDSFVFPITIHPQVSGKPHALMMHEINEVEGDVEDVVDGVDAGQRYRSNYVNIANSTNQPKKLSSAPNNFLRQTTLN